MFCLIMGQLLPRSIITSLQVQDLNYFGDGKDDLKNSFTD